MDKEYKVAPVWQAVSPCVAAALTTHAAVAAGRSIQHRELAFELFAHNIVDRRAVEATGDPAQGGYVYLIRPRQIGRDVCFDQPFAR